MSKLIDTASAEVKSSSSPLEFETAGGGSWPQWYRYLKLNGERAYEIGNVCNTCAFFFERLDGANAEVDVGQLANILEAGVQTLNKRLKLSLAQMMPRGSYQVLLLQSNAQRVEPGASGDYFMEEQARDWPPETIDDEQPHSPKGVYYRLGTQRISPSAMLYEFAIPMLARDDLSSERLSHYCDVLGTHAQPTVVALSVLDVKSHYDGDTDHYCLAHYILDGHHKIEAAAMTGRTIGLASFLAVKQGVSSAEQIAEVIATLSPQTREPKG